MPDLKVRRPTVRAAINGQRGAKHVRRAQHAAPLRNIGNGSPDYQGCLPGTTYHTPTKHRQWLAGLPRMFAGHGMPCPYETSAMARRIAKDVCRARHAVPL